MSPTLAQRVRKEAFAASRGYVNGPLAFKSDLLALLSNPPVGVNLLDLTVDVIRHPNVPERWAMAVLSGEHHLGLSEWEYATVVLGASGNKWLPGAVLERAWHLGRWDSGVQVNLIRNPSTPEPVLIGLAGDMVEFLEPHVGLLNARVLAARPELPDPHPQRLVEMLEQAWLSAAEQGNPSEREARLVLHEILLDSRLSGFLSPQTASSLLLDVALSD